MIKFLASLQVLSYRKAKLLKAAGEYFRNELNPREVGCVQSFLNGHDEGPAHVFFPRN